MGDVAKSFNHTAGETTSSLRGTIQSLSLRAAVQDISTGITPQKRKWIYEDEWVVVNTRAAALKRWRERQSSDASCVLTPQEAGAVSVTNDEENGQDRDSHEGDGVTEQRSEPATSSRHQKPDLASLQSSRSTIPMPPVAIRQPQTTALRTRRKDNDLPLPKVGPTDANKLFNVPRVPRSAIGVSGLARSVTTPQASSALVEKSNIVRRKRDKV